ncbi:g2429 [Coccomyxa elongata]
MLTGADIQALKDYVSAPGNFGQNQAESTVRLHVTHSNLKAEFMELRMDLHMTVEAVKIKLSTHCGTTTSDMILQMKDSSGKLVAVLTEPHRKLGFFSPEDGWVLHIIDTNPNSLSARGWLEDTSKVQKYVMSDADYDARENTYRQYKAQKLKEDPEWTAEKELCVRKGIPYVAPPKKEMVEDEEYQAAEASKLSVGSRCEINPGGKRGCIRYVGKCEGLPPGYWVGVQLDEPVGKNDGNVKGRRYFECALGYGSFLRPNKVNPGDFPEIDEFRFSDEDEI